MPEGGMILKDELRELAGPSWFCERGGFWGTINQLCLCAKCGNIDRKRHDEPRHYRGLFTPTLHLICDECFDSLSDAAALRARASIKGSSDADQ